MKTIAHLIPKTIPAGFCVLFTYAAVSKGLDFENFQVQLAQSPLLSAYAGQVSYGVIALELLITAMLLIPKTQKTGLYAAFALMVAFTAYIYLILNYSDFVPCSCGGILEKMDWTQHLIFNSICVMLAGTAVMLRQKNNMPMVRKSILRTTAWLAILTLLSSGIIIALFFSSEYIIKKENNFTRRFLMHPIIEGQSITLDNDFYYFAGAENHKIFLGNRIMPQNLLTIDSSMTGVSNMTIKLELLKYHYKKLEIKVLGNNYYIFDGTIPVIFKGKLGNPANREISFDDAFFDQLAIVDSATFVFRTISTKTKELTLGHLNINQNLRNGVHIFPHVLQKQKDGVFDSDGYLSCDNPTGKITYIYSYRNQFLVLNPKMDHIQRFQTIDTIKTAEITIKSLSDGSFKMTKPPLKVNGHGKAYKGLLFNPAYLMGRNESVNRWKKSKIIDIYSIDSKDYIGSMYVNNHKGFSMSDFVVNDENMYLIVGNKLIKYQLTSTLKKHFKNGDAENRVKE